MSLLFCDGFDDGLQDKGKWTQWTGFNTILTGGRNGKMVKAADGVQGMKKQVSSADAHSTLVWGFAVKSSSDVFTWGAYYSNFDAPFGTVYGDNGTTPHISIAPAYNNGASLINVWRGKVGDAVLASVSVPTWVADNWYFVECKVVLSDTVGSVIVKVNG